LVLNYTAFGLKLLKLVSNRDFAMPLATKTVVKYCAVTKVLGIDLVLHCCCLCKLWHHSHSHS